MTDRQVWVVAGKLMATHGDTVYEYMFDRLSDVLEDTIAVEDWRRIAVAVDAISSADRPC